MERAGNSKMYIHEFIDIDGLNRANYVHHMTANWSPTAQEERNQLCFGVWPVIGSTGRWPQVVNMWELDGFDGIAQGFALEGSGRGAYDPVLEKWWARAADFRRGGLDRLVAPAPWNRTITELCDAGVSAVCYAHETVSLRPGHDEAFLERVRDDAAPLLAEFGWEPVGSFRTTMRNDDECILIWAIPTWEAWSAFEEAGATDSAIRRWRRGQDDVVQGWERILMVDAPLSPMKTGRQPARSDQTDWDDAAP